MEEPRLYGRRECDKHYAKIERLEQSVQALSIKLEQIASAGENKKKEIAMMQEDLTEIREDVRRLLDVLHHSKGIAWLALSMAAVFGVVITWLITFFKE